MKTGLRFTFGLKEFLRHRLTFEEAKSVVEKNLRTREENFLKLAKKGIFEYPKSPYLPLLKLSHCEYKDVERLVARDGLEAALKILQADGVYITIEEFKCRSRVKRGGQEWVFKEKDFDNPFIASCYEKRSGGTRSAGTRVMVDFDHMSITPTRQFLQFRSWGLEKIPHVILRPKLPHGAGMTVMLKLAKMGINPIRWISLVDEHSLKISLRTRLGISYLFWLGRLYGEKFPEPELIPFEDIRKVAEIVAGISRASGGCCVHTNVSNAVRLCLAARENKIDLSGVRFSGCGEPLTETKKQVIESAGAKYALIYAVTEIGGVLGNLCLRAECADDLHFFKDFMALITYPRKVADTQVDAFLFTTLLSPTPKILLNVESGDYGVVKKRDCGCPYAEMGFDVHISHIRSFEKLTGEGATFYATDLIRLVEEVLPSKFGGSGLDYQLVEQPGPQGLTRLFVFVSPRVGPINEEEVIQTVLNELKKGPDAYRIMARNWAQAKTVGVRREAPVRTKVGKQYPLYIAQEEEAL